MMIPAHLDKLRLLEAARARLDPLDDFELWFWAGMHAGTHAVNAALHHAGLTREEASFATQPGVYLVPRPDGPPDTAPRPLADVLHVGRPAVPGAIPADVAALMHAMEVIEHHRDPCVRGDRAPTAAIVEDCDAALRQVYRLLEARLAGAVR
jgi:hypothetical protein